MSMTYPRAILRFALLTAVLGGTTPALAREHSKGKPKAAKEAVSAEGKDATEPAKATGEAEVKDAKEPVEPVAAEVKPAKAPDAADSSSEEAPAPAKVESKEAKAPAKEPTAAERSEAKQHAARGRHLFENGDHQGAAAELERAYELAPSRALLFHIASAYAAMGKPVEALENLDELLAAEGPLKLDVLERARALKEEQQQHVGQLDVRVNVPAAIEIDGARVAQAPLERPIPVTVGQHLIGAVAEGHMPQRQGMVVVGNGLAEVVFDLKPMEGRLAFVKIYSSIPAVEVLLDDVSLGKTPFADSVAVAPGKHVFELQRPGYMSHRRELKLAEGARASIAFEAEEDHTVAEERGRLVVDAGAGEVTVSIDGHLRGVYRKPIALPAGPHVVRLEKKDFEPMERAIDVPKGGEVEVKVALRSKGVKEAVIAAEARTYRRWAIASLVSGAILAGGGTGLAIWQNGKLPGAEDNLTKAKKDADSQGCNDPKVDEWRLKTCRQAIGAAEDDVDNYKKWRLIGIGGAAVGAALVGLGVVLLATAPDAPATGDEETTLSSLVPVLSAGPDGAGLWLQGRF